MNSTTQNDFKPATDSNRKPASKSNLKPATNYDINPPLKNNHLSANSETTIHVN